MKSVFNIVLISLTGLLGVVFTVLYVCTFSDGFFAEYSNLIIAVSVSIISVLTILTIACLYRQKNIVYKLLLIIVIFITLTVVFMYFLKISGFLDKIDSVEEFRGYISSFGSAAVILFVLIQFLQVVVLPIPSFITVGAGVLLFGALKGAIYSCVGIILGSIVAFYVGRIFGFKVARWIVGEDNLNKGLKTIRGKDRIVLTFMFLFPFFPDDILCFVAGITTISPAFFILMVFVTRIISVFTASFSMNNSIIPYNTWWGILIWMIFFAFTIFMTILIYKKGDKIENVLLNRKKNKKTKKH